MLRNRSRTRYGGLFKWYSAPLEGVNPSLYLDFVNNRYALNGVLISNPMTITRSSTGTRFGPSGLLEVIASGQPRFDYDPATGAAMGLLIEGQRTNIALYSNPTNGQGGVINGTRSFNNTTTNDIWGTTTSCRVTASATASVQHYASGNTISFTSGTAYTLSAFVKAGTVSRVQLTATGSAFGTSQYANFDLSGTGNVLASAGGSAGIKQLSNGWYRVWLTVTATSTSSGAGLIIAFIDSDTATRLPSYTAAGTETFFYDGQQVEAGNFPSSYIPTTSAAVTRAQDDLLYSGFGAIVNYSNATYYIDTYATPETTTYTRYFEASGVGNNQHKVSAPAASEVGFNVIGPSGTDHNSGTPTAVTVDQRIKVAATCNTTALKHVVNAGTIASGVLTADIPSSDLTTINIGNNGAVAGGVYCINSHIREFRYYTVFATDSEMQRITT